MQWYGSVICTHVNTELFTWSSICFSSSSEPKKKREWNPPWWEGKNPPSSTSTEINEFDSTPIWVFQRWKRIWTLILTWEPGGEKFPFFPQGPDLIFWQLWELKAWKMVRSLGPGNKLCLWGLPRSIRGGLQPMKKRVSDTGVLIWWHGRGERMVFLKCADLKRWGCVEWQDCFSCTAAPELFWGIDFLCYKRIGQCDADWPWGHSFNSSALIQQGWHCFLVGSSCPLARPLGDPYLKSRSHLWSFNMHFYRTIQN